jgi:hypothetical protein
LVTSASSSIQVTFDLYPEATISLEVVVDEFGLLVRGPVLWIVDSGPVRLAALSLDDRIYCTK